MPSTALDPVSVALLSEEYEDQGMVSSYQIFLSTDDLFARKESASPFRLADSSKWLIQKSLQEATVDTLEAQPTDPTIVLKAVAYLRG